MDWNYILGLTILGNAVWRILSAVGALVVGLIFVKILRTVVLHRIKRWTSATRAVADDFLVASLEKAAIPLLYFAVFYFAVYFLQLSPPIVKGTRFLAALILTICGIRFGIELINFLIQNFWLKTQDDPAQQQIIRGLVPLVKFGLWTLGIVFFLDNLGYEVSTVLAGLGIGGVAVALAAQAILGDLFSYFAIMFDRPFVVGDFIIAGDYLGTIEHIGIKTTRIRSLSGEQIVFSNTDLTGSRIRNYKRMEKRRVVFKVGVVYETPLDKLKQIPGILKDAVLKQQGTVFDRAHFMNFGDFSLDFEIVYFVLSADYNIYMDVHQAILHLVAEEFQKRQITIAYPTQTLYLQKAGVN
jgi:small-conductance mechanosensitive channel